MKKLTKLTKTQSSGLDKAASDWIKLVTSGETDDEAAKKAINQIYENGGLVKPKIIIFMDSPIKCLKARFYAAYWLDQLTKGNDQVRTQVLPQVHDQVRDQVSTQVNAQQLWQYNTFSIWWSAWWIWRKVCLDLVGQKSKADAIIDMWKARVSWVWMYPEITIACRMPKIYRDNKGRLHSTTQGAVVYPDGYSFYFLHGIPFSETEFKDFTSGKTQAIDIMNEKNQDKKRVLAMVYGNAKMVKELNAKVCSEEVEDDGNLMRILSIDRENETPLVYYEAIDPAKNELIYLRIPPEFVNKTPLEAKCWSFKELWVLSEKLGEMQKFEIEA